MKQLIFVILAILVVANVCAADQTLQQWGFAGASDSLGWTSVGGAIGLDKAEGALMSAGTDCKVVSPMFEIEAGPRQCVEIEMKSDKLGLGRVFYSNTIDEPYGGFRGELQAQFYVAADGKYHKYVVIPNWQSQGKIVHIRIDCPGEKNSIRSVKIVALETAKPADKAEWTFSDTAGDWRALGMDAEPKLSRTGWALTGTRNSMALSPALDIDADATPILTLRLASKSPHRVIFRWISAGRDGVQSVPIDVKGGGAFRSYNMDLTSIPEWSGRILAVGVAPTDDAKPASIILDTVAVAKAAVGPAEVRINRFGLADPVTRAGDKAKIVIEAVNIGGAEARSVLATVTLVSGATPKVLPVKSADHLAPGKTVRFEWETTFSTAETLLAASSVGADKAEPDQKQARLCIYPKLDAAANGLSYVPEPQVVDTGEYQVGCYYFPGWRDYGAWSALNDYPERKPILGYAHDGDPEVVDWQINWALSHGISFFIYDWYWNKGSRQLEEGLHDGFFKAEYQDKMKFCLLWANHNGPGSHSEKDMLAVTKYWIDNYFKRPNYVKVGGKNVMVIFNPAGITQDMGVAAAKAAFAKMKKLCEDSGVGGLYLVACSWQIPERIKEMEEEGYDAFSGYNYPSAGCKGLNVAPYEWMVDGYKDIWDQIAAYATVPYIPLCEAGWDSRPWHGPNARVRTGKSAELWQKMLTNAKAYDDDPKHKLPAGKKLVFLEAWNEFGEGDYIEPNVGFGFGYLEAVRQVFAPKSKPPTIVVPRDLGLGPYEIAPPALRTQWDFSKSEDRAWTPGQLTTPTYDGGVLKAESTGSDPMLSSLWADIDAAKFRKLEVRMKIDKPGEAQLFFTRKREGLSEGMSVKFAVTGDDQFHTYTVDMAANPRWTGTITGLRFDPIGVQGAKIEIASIKFGQ